MDEIPEIKTSYPGPKSRQIIDVCQKHECTGLKSFSSEAPLVFARGDGSLLEDADGNTYLDLSGSYAATNLGHCPDYVVRAIKNQTATLMHCPSDYLSPARKEFLEALISLLPPPLSRVFYAITGAEANEIAIKLAKHFKGRTQFISFQGAYHGFTQATLTVSGNQAYKKRTYTADPPTYFVPYPYCYRCFFGKNYPECSLECLEFVRSVFNNPYSGIGEVAAIFIEPIQGAGGSIVPPKEFLTGLVELSREYGAVLIIDEIQTGFGRTGRTWAMEHFGVVPDLLTFGKGIGGGLAVSVVAGTEDIMTAWTPGSHSTTFMTNAVNHCAAAAAIRFFLENDIAEKAASSGDYFLRRLAEELGDLNGVGDIRGKGLLLGIEIVADNRTKNPASEKVGRIRGFCQQRGLLVLKSGYYGNVLKISPPLVITREQIDFSVKTLKDAILEAFT